MRSSKEAKDRAKKGPKCPACKSSNIYVRVDGSKKCHRCGNITVPMEVKKPPIKIELQVVNSREELERLKAEEASNK